MDIKDILDSLGLNLTDPEARRGAMDAIEAILASRNTSGNIEGNMDISGSQDEIDIEIDPDLLQPSIKNQANSTEEEPEIDDEENLLDQVKHNDSEDSEDGEISKGASNSDDSSSTSSTNDSTESTDNTVDDDETDSDQAGELTDNETDTPNDDSEETLADGDDGSQIDDENKDSFEDQDSTSTGNNDGLDQDTEEIPDTTKEDSEVEKDEEDEVDVNDILDNEMQDTYKDAALKAKENARRIKRERTLQAARNTLAKAVAKKANASLIRELEKAIADLESLQEAISKKLADISDEEFNLLVNRVFDAIDALGDSGLTYSSDEDRQLKAKEIKADLGSSKTQNELSAEDVAKIRAETQAVKAREKELKQNQPRSRSSFKGFQEFLNSLYRAVALQVKINEVPDDSWSAINRRYSGSGVLQPGKKIQEVPDSKIPVIDFYFDQSGSWSESDIAIGQKAVDILSEMEAAGKIKINVYYFSEHVHSDAASARAEGSTRAWNDIIKNIVVTNATNVIVMTDDDMEYVWASYSSTDKQPLKHTVPGYVWYLWKNGYNAPRLPKDLKGRGGTQQFSFSRGDL